MKSFFALFLPPRHTDEEERFDYLEDTSTQGSELCVAVEVDSPTECIGLTPEERDELLQRMGICNDPFI